MAVGSEILLVHGLPTAPTRVLVVEENDDFAILLAEILFEIGCVGATQIALMLQAAHQMIHLTDRAESFRDEKHDVG